MNCMLIILHVPQQSRRNWWAVKRMIDNKSEVGQFALIRQNLRVSGCVRGQARLFDGLEVTTLLQHVTVWEQNYCSM
jgi:hypothetical protein